MADSDEVHNRLLSLFPLESPDGTYSVQLVEVVRPPGEDAQVVLRVVQWNVTADGKRGVESLHEQPILIGAPGDSADTVVRRALSRSLAAQAVLAAHQVSGGFPPIRLFGGGSVGWPSVDVPDDGWTLTTPVGQLSVSEVVARDDSLWANVWHIRPNEERSAEVLWMDFPDDRPPEVRPRYEAAMLGISWALMTMAPGEVVGGLALEDWFDASLLDDPANQTVVDFVQSWIERPCAAALLDAWAAQA